ncbi:PREDICTED: uncharacterized protein LOC105561086 [Vollenhovia emeryi]|uniref:uncharacterized protein LOC105561086 n=1 Tax=Vollenhovia emeryi TaxID=411798 RepID=UPI0005F583B4|nr:PREDICTED: uncharacterized protein LOC105561086 [Vollenhovia emeryi]
MEKTAAAAEDSFGKNRSGSEISRSKRFSSKVCEEPRSSGVTDREPEKPIGTDVIVSNTGISDNSVTVSVICPERTPEPFSRNQPKRKYEGDASLDRFSFQCGAPVVSDKSLACRWRQKISSPRLTTSCIVGQETQGRRSVHFPDRCRRGKRTLLLAAAPTD